jgi:serralysin
MCSICFNKQHLTSENAAGVDADLGDPGTYSSDYINGLVWGGGWSNETVYFTIDQGLYEGGGWLTHQITAIDNAVAAYNNVCNIDLSYVSPGDANVDIIFATLNNSDFVELFGISALGIHEVPEGTDNFAPFGLGAEVCLGVYNWSLFSADTDSFDIGGFDYVTLIHELGHGLGLAHPHDTGGYSTIFPGVTSSFGDYGDNNQNQGIFTTMSYNDGWQTEYPSHTDIGYGYQGTPMAFDIAALQILYGANNSYNTENNAYHLPTVNGQNQNTYWSCIWDAGGTDTISNAGSSINCTINLNEAPLTGANAGGYVSWNSNIVGGFTIANGVVIENATGGSGNDTLTGNSADNTLNGGAGNDTLVGGNGNDTYIVDSTSDVVTESASAGTDTIQSSITLTIAENVENLTLTGGTAINGKGNTLNNLITGNGANNILSGGGGNDYLIGGGGNDTLNGGLGADTLNGGLGDDTFVVNTGTDVVIESASAGTDTIQSSITLTIAENVENLELTGGAAINGTGNTLNNLITGNGANNILSGGGGNDTLNGGGGNDTLNGGLGLDTLGGGLGNDTLTGGNGLDIFLFDTALGVSNVDTITDFNLTQDKIRLDDDIFSALSSIGAGNFVSAAGATALDANDYLIFNTTNNYLYYDADGSGTDPMVHFATLNVDITSHTSFELTVG